MPMRAALNRFISIFRIELEDLEEDINDLLEILEKRERVPKTDLALSAHTCLAEGLACLASEKAHDRGVKTAGFTGGVAFNEIITSKMRDIVESSGLRFLVNEAVPAGDGGTSFGQAVIAGLYA